MDCGAREEETSQEKNKFKNARVETFILTAYCPCEICSEGWGNQTSTGVLATAGRTIAVDPRIIPYGTEVIIDGKSYFAEDCGGLIKENKIDIFFESHQETIEFGKQEKEVIICY